MLFILAGLIFNTIVHLQHTHTQTHTHTHTHTHTYTSDIFVLTTPLSTHLMAAWPSPPSVEHSMRAAVVFSHQALHIPR